MRRRLAATLIGVTCACGTSAFAAGGIAAEDVPVPGGVDAFAQALGIDPTPDRGRYMAEVTRLVHENPAGRKPSVVAFLQTLTQQSGRAPRNGPGISPAVANDLVPVPLTADLWSRAVFHRKVAREELVGAIVADHTASLLCHGLASLDDQTLEYVADHPSILTRLAERSAPVFAVFSSGLRVRSNRIVPPDAPDSTPLWEAVLAESVTRPEAFILRLFETGEGRLAYLYDTVAQLDPPRRAFALGAWIANPATRLERFKALATSGIGAYRDWHVRTLPFNRGSYDLAMTLTRVTVDQRGMPVAPAARNFWARVFSGSDLPDDAGRQLRGGDEEAFDAAWLTEAVGAADVRQRTDRLDQIVFGQRRFASATESADTFLAIRALARYRTLVLTLERIGITAPAVYAAAARQAARIGTLDSRRGFLAEAQFQGGLAIVWHMTAARTIDAPAAQSLIERLVAAPLGEDGRYNGAVAQWIRDDVLRAAPAAPTAEARLISALSGPATGTGDVVRLTWEGQRYRLDLGAAERLRLSRVREKQDAVPIDLALDLAFVARALASERMSADDMQAVLTRVVAASAGVPERTRQEEDDVVPPGGYVPPEAHAILRKAADELSKALKNRDVRRAPRIGEPIAELADELLAHALLSFAYASDLGDPDGTILLAEDVSRRHDFGFGVKDGETRSRVAWMLPRQDVSPNAAWHIAGSLLGLDVALAPLALRRVNFERVLDAPRLTSNQRDAFAVSVAFMNPFSLRDADRDAIVDAIERGRRRVAALSGPDDFDAVGVELGFDGIRRRALAWTLTHEPDRLESMFSLTELLLIGGGRADGLDAWGMSMLSAAACLCSRLTPPGRWSTLAGRPQLAIAAAGMADLNLHVARRLRELQLPAALARVVLSAAMQDYIDEVRPTDDSDWITLTRAARVLTREQVEDYVAAATAAGPLMPDSEK